MAGPRPKTPPERNVSEMWHEGRRAYPGLELDEATFHSWLVQTPTGNGAAVGDSKGHVADLFLACACAEKLPGAIELFERVLTSARAALVRAGGAAPDVDDALQLLRERLLVGGHIRDFSGRGSLAAWTRVSLAHQLATLQRARGRTAVRERQEASQLAAVDPELALLRQRYSGEFRAAISDAFDNLTVEQRNILRLHFVDGVGLEGMAAILRFSRATAGRRVQEARTALLEGTMALLGKRLHASPSEVESLFRAVRSALEVSLCEYMRR